MASGVKLTGQAQAAARLRQLGQRFGDRIAGALYRRAEAIMADSKVNYVPVDLGSLKNSGKVFPPVRKGREVSVTMSYGDTAAPHALAIHDHPSEHSPPSWRGKRVVFSPAGTGPKYLERPLLAAVPRLPAELAADLALG